MTEVADVQHLWQQLPYDIWSHIISCLPAYNYRPFNSALSLDDASPESLLSRSTCSPLQISQDCTQYQRQVLNLGTVCRAFDTVLSANPQLYASVALNKQSIAEAAGSLAAMVQWTAQHSKTVEHIVACGDMDVLHHVLNALQTPLNTLTTAVVEDHTGQSVHQLAAFKNLQKLTLCGSCEDNNTLYSLQPLTHLPVLSNLALHYCTVLDLQAAEHVTSLELVQCEASCTQPRAPVQSIEDIYLCHSSIDAFHVDGIYACTGLKSLICFDSSVAAIDSPAQDFVLGEHEACIAESLTKLSSLTTLNFSLANVSCIPVLVSLEFVRVDFWPWLTDELKFPKHFLC